MAGVDLRTVQELGEWRSLAMVQRYTHYLAPDHLRAAVERLVSPAETSAEGVGHSALGLDLDRDARSQAGVS